MKLLYLKLNNFQGIRHLDMAFHGANAHIYGDNATGKTTVLNALTWLLFDKPITGAKGFTPKTMDALNADIAASNAAFAEAQASLISPKFEDSPEHEDYSRAMEEIGRCRETRIVGALAQEVLVAPYDAEIQTINGSINTLQDEIGKIRLAETQKTRIAELEAQEVKLAEEYEALERGVMLCEDFIRAKVRMLDERINSRFETVRFRLFKEQINGGLAEGCEVLVAADGGALVPYRDANNAARINAGLEIIDTLGAAFGQYMPVCVDNAESVTRLRPINAQLLAMVVSEKDKALRLELDDAMKEAM